MSCVVRIRNVGGGTEEIGDYEYDVLIGGHSGFRTIASGKVYAHRRSRGWQALVQAVLKNEDDGQVHKRVYIDTKLYTRSDLKREVRAALAKHGC